MLKYDIVIIGGGIFGCSVAKFLSEQTDRDICLVEKEERLAQHQSGRNSGTLHLGVVTEAEIEPGSQLAEFTIEGTRRLKTYCTEHDLPIHDEGILKVGQSEAEQSKVRNMYDDAVESGVEADLLESQAAINELEPNVRGENALFSPESATVDTEAITKKLLQQAERNGVDLYVGCEVTGIERAGKYVLTETEKSDIRADYFVNTAGAKALDIAQAMGVGHEYQAVPFRGAYYELVPDRRSLINSNVYPTNVGDSFQVGVHFTRRPDARVIVGPTGMIALGDETYGKTEFDLRRIKETVTNSNFLNFIGSRQSMQIAFEELNKTYRKSYFLSRCQKLVPEVRSEDIEESYVGISHWLFDEDGQRIGDPVIEQSPRGVHLIMPQPGFTAALTTGEYISEIVQNNSDTASNSGRVEPATE